MRIRQLLLLQLCTAWYVGKCDEGREMGASSNAAHRCLRLAAPQATVAASEALPPADVAVARALWDATVQFRPGPPTASRNVMMTHLAPICLAVIALKPTWLWWTHP